MAIDLSETPKLRWPLDVQYLEHQGAQFALLRDNLGVAPEAALVPVVLLPIVSRFDGEHSLSEVLEEGRQFGLTEELLEGVLQQLDQFWLLDNSKTQQKLREIKEEYRRQPVRETALAGKVYPATAAALDTVIVDYIEKCTVRVPEMARDEELIALAAPHIDYERGWATYAVTYQALRQTEPDVVFLFGTSHQPGEALFHLTDKDFANPLGPALCAKDSVARISKDYGIERSFEDEVLHKHEHSLELQLPFLLHAFPAVRRPLFVPVLVGSFHHTVMERREPIGYEEIHVFVKAVVEEIQRLRKEGAKVLLFGGVDLAHVGLHFGDTQRVSDQGLPKLEAEDRELIRALCQDSAGFFKVISKDCDSRRICGFSSLYTMLAVMEELCWKPKGRCLDYRQAVEPISDCIVTFASLSWTIKA